MCGKEDTELPLTKFIFLFSIYIYLPQL